MVRVIPGVEVEVVKEIVPKQLYPAGVIGMIGTAAFGPEKPEAVTSFREMTEKYGPGTLVKEAKQAFLNGVFQIVALKVKGEKMKPSISTAVLKDEDGNEIINLILKENIEPDAEIEVKLMDGSAENTMRIEILKGNDAEVEDKLEVNSLIDYINQRSKWLKAEPMVSGPVAQKNPVPQELRLEGQRLPEPDKIEYENALETLELEPEIDVVYACDVWDPEIHALVNAHCINMSLGKEPKPLGPRIGIGTVRHEEPVEEIIKRTETLHSDRFVIAAPHGVAGSLAGLISKLNYYDSPTFKPLVGISNIERRYTPSEQMRLLRNGILPVDAVRGRGIIVVKGITTDTGQISVQRISDWGLRGIKSIADDFIGRLNNERGRGALRQRCREFLNDMANSGALVPSTDNTEPAYLVDVYSSQKDFAQGVVRMLVKTRPVRAMDYIQATINIQA